MIRERKGVEACDYPTDYAIQLGREELQNIVSMTEMCESGIGLEGMVQSKNAWKQMENQERVHGEGANT